MQETSLPSAVGTVSEDLLQAAREFFPDYSAADAIPGHPDVVKITTPASTGRVRRWPSGVLATDIAFSHEVMATARDAGVTPVPRLVSPPTVPDEPSLRIGNRRFDAQEWLPGAPSPRSEAAWPNPEDRIDIPVVLTPAAFSAVIAAAARLHDATTIFAARHGIPTAPLSMLPGAVRQAHGRHLAALRARARREPSVQRWLATGERLMAAAEPIVLATPEDPGLPATVLHLGLWPAHVLLESDALTGLLGWERVAAGSPLLDIAQATLRLQGWSDESVEVALGAYGEARPLSPEERRLLPAVAALDAVASTGRLLEQTYAVDETARPPTAVRAAIDMMLRSMTALDRSLIAQATVGKSKRTPWRRGPRPTTTRVQEQEGGKSRARRR
jgi:aminoglycoside phosphotransferase (APT) family kinase protein